MIELPSGGGAPTVAAEAERGREAAALDRGSALVVTVLLLALAGVLATALAELGRLALGRARLDRDGVRAWFLAEGGLAETVAALPPGWSFTDPLRDAPGPPPAEGAPWTWRAGFLDDADEIPRDDTTDGNATVILRIAAYGPSPVRRRLEAVLGRSPDPVQPGALTLAGDIGSLTADFLLDGRDFDMTSGCLLAAGDPPRAGLSLPDGAAMPLLPAGQVHGADPAIARGPAPEYGEVAGAAPAIRVAGGVLAAELGDAADPRFHVVDGDALADAATTAFGALYVAGRLRVTGRLAVTGVLAAANGIEVAPGGELAVCGGAWAAGAPALDVHGRGSVRASAAALRLAARLAPLPAAARIVAVREPS